MLDVFDTNALKKHFIHFYRISIPITSEHSLTSVLLREEKAINEVLRHTAVFKELLDEVMT